MKGRSQKTLMAADSTWEALDNIARACGLEVENGLGAGKPAIETKDMFPNKTRFNKVLVYGNPYYWSQHTNAWVRDYQARKGEYDNAPICSDPENFK